MSGKKIIIGIIIIFSLVVIAIGIIYKININKEKTFYATVTEVSKGYILAKPQPGEKIRDKADIVIIHTDDEYKVDDSILVHYKGEVPEVNPSSINVLDVELISTKVSGKKSKENLEEDDVKDNVVDNSSQDNNNDKNNSIDVNNNTDSGNNSNSVDNNTAYTENDVIEYFNDKLNEVSSYDNTINYKEKAKNIFVTAVDFLFYDGKIKGHTFKDLSDSGKLKVLGIVFNIDSKINEKFPGYKEELSSKYHDAKDKIVVKYLELTANVCANHDEYCDKAKDVWKTIKEKAGISWSTIKKYASNGISNLKDWYEIYKSK